MAVSKAVVDGDEVTWRELLCGDPGAVSVKATYAVLGTVLSLGMSSTEEKERLCCSRRSSSKKITAKFS